MSSKKSFIALVLTFMFVPFLQGQTPPSQPAGPAAIAFRDAVAQKPKGTPGGFKLSHNYPSGIPAKCPECTWLNIPVNFKPQFPSGSNQIQSPQWHGQHWDEYITAIINYVKEEQDPNLSNEVGWKTVVNGKTRWYNVPWMAYDPTAGREWVHGTTNERTATLGAFVDTPELTGPHAQFFLRDETDACKAEYPWGFESWSVGYYNEYGGYAMGQAIPPSGVPQASSYLGAPIAAGLPFPTGTVVVKILTSNVPPDCVPFLKGSPEWMVDRHKYTKAKGYECEREVQPDHVVQVDVAVVDPRSPTRWVYGTFAYDSDTPGATFWDHLVPVGLQWGSDPWSFPAVPQADSLPIQAECHQYRHRHFPAPRLQRPSCRSRRQSAVLMHLLPCQRLRPPMAAPLASWAVTFRQASALAACAWFTPLKTRTTSRINPRHSAFQGRSSLMRSVSIRRCNSLSLLINTGYSTPSTRPRSAPIPTRFSLPPFP